MDPNLNKIINLYNQKKLEEAEKKCREVSENNNKNPEFFNIYAAILYQLNQNSDAIDKWKKALKLNPKFVFAYNNIGNVLHKEKKFEDAIKNFDQAISIKEDYFEPYFNKANVLFELKKYDEAIKNYKNAIEIKKDYFQAFNNLGSVLLELKKYEEALQNFNKAIDINFEYISAHKNRLSILQIQNRLDIAKDELDVIIKLDPKDVESYIKRSIIFDKQNNLKDSLNDLQSARKISPSFPFLFGNILSLKTKMCDWENYEKYTEELEKRIKNSEKIAEPYTVTTLIDSQSIQKKASKIWTLHKEKGLKNNVNNFKKKVKSKKIRLGYYSADLRNHPVGQLIVRVLELHNRSNFEVYCFFFGNKPPENDSLHKRIIKSCDKFFDVNLMSDSEIITLSKNNNIDITIDLMGHTMEKNRFELFIQRCSPIQISFIGFPGTSGSNSIDYIIADKKVIPKENQKFFTEKIIYLPHCYLPSEELKKIPETFSDKKHELPKKKFVLCCFNAHKKINPNVFNIWMRLLKDNENSVLWLLQEENNISSENIKFEATKRGLDPKRILFVERLPLNEHLARVKQADLFLDTFPYNAHTTCNDTLRAGTLLLTLEGNSFHSRVAASHLKSIGLDELIAKTVNDYEMIANKIIKNNEYFESLCLKLKENQNNTALFNSKNYTKNLEKALTNVYENYFNDKPSQNIEI